MREYAAVEVGVELVFDELRQAGADDAATVVYFCGDALGRCAHERLGGAIE